MPVAGCESRRDRVDRTSGGEAGPGIARTVDEATSRRARSTRGTTRKPLENARSRASEVPPNPAEESCFFITGEIYLIVALIFLQIGLF